MKKSNSYSPEVRERAVRMVLENLKDYPSEWAAIESIAPKIGCVPQTLHGWVRKHQTDNGQRPGQTTEERDRIKALERENRELRKANEILRLASAYFAQAELDRRPKCWWVLLMSIVLPMASSRSAGSCRLRHHSITTQSVVSVIPNDYRLGSSEMPC